MSWKSLSKIACTACIFLQLAVNDASAQVNIPRGAEADVVAKEAEAAVRTPSIPMVEGLPSTIVEIPDEAKRIHLVLADVVIEGGTVYKPSELTETYRNLVGKYISLADICVVAAKITQRYLADDYLLVKAYVPAQAIRNGFVHVKIVEGYVNHVRWEGQPLDSAIAQDMANRLMKEIPLKGKTLESIMLKLNDLPGVHAEATLVPGGEEGAVDIIITVTRKRIDASLNTDDYAARYLGVWENTGQVNVNGVVTPVDKLSVSGSASFDPNMSRYGRGEYSIPVNEHGTTVAAGISESDSAPGYTLERLDIRSNALSKWVSVSDPVVRTRAENLTVTGQFNINDVNTDVLDERFYTDRIRTLQLSAAYNRADDLNGTNQLNVDLYKGLNILSATPDDSPGISRAEGHDDFIKAVLNASRLQPIDDHFSIYTAATGQWANVPLLTSEQFGFGGPTFGRAYDPYEISGDDGAAGSVELRYDWPFSDKITAQPYIFYDIGRVWDIGNTGPTMSGASAGFGSRFTLSTHFQLDWNVAKPLTLPDTDPKLGATGNDPRINVGLKVIY